MSQHAPFFIVGLPRSRTAWLANFLTYGPAFCLHDGLRHCERPEDLAARLAATGAEFPGDADPTIPLFYPQIHALFPQARYVFVERNVGDALTSYAQCVEGLQTPEQIDTGFERCRAALCAMRTALRNQHTLNVRYEDLDKPATCQAIWSYCVPSEAFNPLRWEQLEEMRVEVIVAKVSKRLDLERVKRLAGQVGPLMGEELPVKGTANSPLKLRYYQALADLCGPNRAAFTWLLQVMQVSSTWDHLNDGDPVDKQLAGEAFEGVLLDWPVNEFWTQHAAALRPVLAAVLGAWRQSNGPEGDPFQGWNLYGDLPLAVALQLGGRELVNRWNQPVRELVRELYQAHQKEAA